MSESTFQPNANEDARRLNPEDAAERRTLKWVFGINLIQFSAISALALAADSTGLLGAAVDNLSDAAVYAVSLYVVGRTVAAKSRAARLSGILQIGLGLAVLGEVLRRFIGGAEPVGSLMIVTAIANAATNAVCLRLLRSHRGHGVHLQASWIFTTNDMIANGGILVSGATVMWFKSQLPDLIIGVVVATIVLNGGREILRQAKQDHFQRGDTPGAADGGLP